MFSERTYIPMNQKQLEIFTTLAQTLNFTKTAEQLFLSQTTVTLQIHALEEELHAKLFDRTSRSVRLTYAGRIFYEGAQEILKKIQQTAQLTADAAKGYTGHLEIGYADDVNAAGISTVLRGFSLLCSRIRLQIHGGYPAALLDGLLKDRYDLIFTPSFRGIRKDKLQFHTIGTYKTIAAFHQGHRFSQKEFLTYSDFENENFIYISGTDQELDFSSEFLHRLEQAGVHIHIFSRNDDIDSVFLMLDSDMGVTVLPEYFIGRFYGTSQIRTCPIRENLKPTDFLAVWKQGKRSEELEEFLQYAGYLQ